MTSSPITKIYRQLDTTLKNDPNLQEKIQIILRNVESSMINKELQRDERYALRFTIPTEEILEMYAAFNLNRASVGDAFRLAWQHPETAKIHGDPYYHVLLLIIRYGLKNKVEGLAEKALFVILTKVWNGMRTKYLPRIDQRVLAYVVNCMATGKHLVTKHDGPCSLLRDHFVPTLLKKYGHKVRSDRGLRELFSQSLNRIGQIFAQDWNKNPITNKSEAQGGLLAMYRKAQDEGWRFDSTVLENGDEEAEDTTRYYHVPKHPLHKEAADYIVNVKPQYAEQVLENLNRETGVSRRIVEKIFRCAADNKYSDILEAVIEKLLSRINASSVVDIGDGNFFAKVQQNVINSKNNDAVRDIHKLTDLFLADTLQERGRKPFHRYGRVQRAQFRKVFIFAIVHYLNKFYAHDRLRLSR